MRSTALIVSVLVLSACRGWGDRGGSADTLGVAPVLPAGATAAPAGTVNAHPVVGAWRLVQQSPPRGDARGVMLSLAIDSVRAATAYGRLTRYAEGNTEMDPAAWGPLTGATAGDSVRLAIPRNGDGGRALLFAGVLAADTIRVSRFRVGASDYSTGARWLLVRER